MIGLCKQIMTVLRRSRCFLEGRYADRQVINKFESDWIPMLILYYLQELFFQIMLISNWMSKPVIIVDANDSMKDARKLLKENNIRILPVMEHGKLEGVITDRDLKRASAF